MKIMLITSEKFRKHNDVHLANLKNVSIVSDIYGGNDYPSNEPKTLASVVLSAENEWTLHLDHDAWIDVNAVVEYSKTAEKTKAHGHIINSWGKDYNHYYLSGPAYLLSHLVSSKLIKVIFNTPVTMYGDVTLGLALKMCSVPLHEWNIEFKHYQKPDQLEELYKNWRQL